LASCECPRRRPGWCSLFRSRREPIYHRNSSCRTTWLHKKSTLLCCSCPWKSITKGWRL
jgi:hypothetical protein